MPTWRRWTFFIQERFKLSDLMIDLIQEIYLDHPFSKYERELEIFLNNYKQPEKRSLHNLLLKHPYDIAKVPLQARITRHALSPYREKIYYKNKVSFQHTRFDLIAQGLFDDQAEPVMVNLPCDYGPGYHPGKRFTYNVTRSAGSSLLQLQITGQNPEHLKRIIESIREIDFVIGGMRVDGITGLLLRLKLYLISQKNPNNVASLPIFEGFCQPDRPDYSDNSRYHDMKIHVETYPTRMWTGCMRRCLFEPDDKSYERCHDSMQPLFQAQFMPGDIRDIHLRQEYEGLLKQRFIGQFQCMGDESINSSYFKTRLHLVGVITHLIVFIYDNDIWYDYDHYDIDAIDEGQWTFLDLIEEVSLFINGFPVLYQIPGFVLSQDIPKTLGLSPLPKEDGKAYYLLNLSHIEPSNCNAQVTDHLWGLPEKLDQLDTLCDFSDRNMMVDLDIRLNEHKLKERENLRLSFYARNIANQLTSGGIHRIRDTIY